MIVFSNQIYEMPEASLMIAYGNQTYEIPKASLMIAFSNHIYEMKGDFDKWELKWQSLEVHL